MLNSSQNKQVPLFRGDTQIAPRNFLPLVSIENTLRLCYNIFMTQPEQPFIPIDREDQEADKLGSYALGHHRLTGEEPFDILPVPVPKPDKKPMSSARRRAIAISAIGGQPGHDRHIDVQPIPTEQQAVNTAGRARIQKVLDQVNERAALKKQQNR